MACYGGTDVMERSCAVARGKDINNACPSLSWPWPLAYTGWFPAGIPWWLPLPAGPMKWLPWLLAWGQNGVSIFFIAHCAHWSVFIIVYLKNKLTGYCLGGIYKKIGFSHRPNF
jgi:hypothetical protein